MSEDDLVPVFVPPLALVLAHAETTGKRRLTQGEVIGIRDKAVCIMMKREDTATMTKSRGYRDVEPEDCWADWHRLRPQFAGGCLPRIILCAVGDASFAHAASKLLGDSGVEFEVRERDSSMERSFAVACRTLSREALSRIGRHSHVVYALSKALEAQHAVEAAGQFLKLAASLCEHCGAYGIKCDSSGIAHENDTWLRLAASCEAESPWELVDAFVQPLIGDSREVWSCGMHLLGRPDMIAQLDQLPTELRSLAAFRELSLTFATYLLCECSGTRYFSSGSTFRCNSESPRVRVLFELCQGYDEDDYFHNPFGRYRFVAM
jgi:hypothetical protein